MLHRCGLLLLLFLIAFSGCDSSTDPGQNSGTGEPWTELPDEPYTLVLGIAQDAGAPQAGCRKPCCRGRVLGEAPHYLPSCLALVDPRSGKRWLFEATPALPEQLVRLNAWSQGEPGELDPVDGIFTTHAHMGHYAGLIHLGREAIGSKGIPVHAMPRMAEFLRAHGPWSQLCELGNIEIRGLEADTRVELDQDLFVTPFLVPHRDEFSETVGFLIEGPNRRIAWLPDIDKWDRWERPLEDLIAEVDVAYLDGTFFGDGELPGRDMSQIPHPFIEETMARLSDLPADDRAKVRFIHLNHTNPALDPTSAEGRGVEGAGFGLARPGEPQPL